MQIRPLTLDEWGDALPASGFEWAHRLAALPIDEHTRGELRLYGGFNGQQPVGLSPSSCGPNCSRPSRSPHRPASASRNWGRY